MKVLHSFSFCLISLLIVSNAAASNCSEYIVFQSGNIPILLTAPHGAPPTALLPNVPPRVGKNIQRFVNQSDRYTDTITLEISRFLQKQDLKPFVVIAAVHRSQIDFNRPAVEAYEVERAADCYDAYHQLIRQSIDAIRARWSEGFLLDIHGQSTYDDDIIRGTRNDQTIKRLKERYDRDVTEEVNGLFFELRELGYKLTPKPFQREQYYAGGFTLKQYGSHNANGIDALQVEVGKKIRVSHSQRKKFIKDFSGAINSFYQAYYTE